MTTDYTSRWNSGRGLSAHVAILRAIAASQIEAELSPFEKVGGCCDLRGFPSGSLRQITGCTFKDIDLSKADLASIRLEKCTFTNVRFERTNLSGINDHGNRFENCSFLHSALNGAVVGAEGTSYSDCIFDHCDLRGTSFVRPEFDRCSFTSCRLNGVDFNGSSFVETSFVGTLDDVWFRGGFAYPSDTKNFGGPRKNAMLRVSFAAAELRWVTFSDDCDLSTITLPSDGKHRLYNCWKSRLNHANSMMQRLENEEQIRAVNYLRIFQAHAEAQDWYILNVQEVIEELGEDVGAKVLHALSCQQIRGI